MQIKRTASANWKGTGKEGTGLISTQSTVLSQTQFGFNSRFADGIGTNPEELIGAAHAGCFSMKLAFNLQGAGFMADNIDTKATVILENGTITEVQLQTSVSAKGLTSEKLTELANNAKANCPISKLLNAKISLDTKLI
ncbi:MAG: OsmC family protein [Flammeovirgaceae bacterium]